MTTYAERLRIIDDPAELRRYYEAYHLPTAAAAEDFICRFGFTYDPRLHDAKTVPFELYPKQREFIRWLWARYRAGEEGVVDKCRTAGFSWTTMAFAVYLILFHRDVSIGVYTFKESEAHTLGDLSTLIEKCIFTINHLPKAWRVGVKMQHMHIQNAVTGSDIVGSSGDNPGRGGRRSMFIADEAAFYPRPEMIEAATIETANCRIWGSTHSGTASLFYRKATAGTLPVFTFDWWDNPTHDQAWFDAKRASAESQGLLHIFRREIERNAAASVDAVLIPPEWVAAASQTEHVSAGHRIAALDVADEGGDTNALVIRDGNALVYAEERAEGDTTETADWAFWKAVEHGCSEFRFDAIGVGAGVKARVREIQQDTVQMRVVPYFASGAVIRPKDLDYNDKPNADVFANKKAQDYWSLRTMFLNTYRATQGKDHDAEKLIHVTGDSQPMQKLIRELSQPQHRLSMSGKWMVDKKPKGTKSPNIADAAMMAMAEVETEWRAWSIV
jgi:hypothetical protein